MESAEQQGDGRRAGRPAVFVDRDGTLNEPPPPGCFLTRPEDVLLLPGEAVALRRLKEAGYLIVVFSNQSGVARGVMTLADVEAVNARLAELLAGGGAQLDGVYFCPHRDGDGCECRKPRPGMLLSAAKELGIDLTRSWGLGDAARDLAAARAAGCRVILVRGTSSPCERPSAAARLSSPKSAQAGEAAEELPPDASVPDLPAAADVILASGGSQPATSTAMNRR